LIKVMNLVSILVAPFATRPLAWTARGGIIAACLLLLGIAIAFSKRGSLAEALQHEVLASEGNRRP